MSDTYRLTFTGTLALTASAPVVSLYVDGRWRLREPMEVRIFGAKAVVPAGFPTDFASVPRPLKMLFPNALLFSASSVFHDWLYKLGVDKDLADAVFYAMMKQELREWKQEQAYSTGWRRQIVTFRILYRRSLALAMWQCVQWFGGFAYAAHRRADVPRGT